MFRPKIKVSQALYDKIKLACEVRGGSSIDEFVEKIVTDEVDSILRQAGKADLSASEVEDIANKLKGLGYLE